MKPLTKHSTIDDIIAHIMESKNATGDIKSPPRELIKYPRRKGEPKTRKCKICQEVKPIENFRTVHVWSTDDHANKIGEVKTRRRTCRRCELDKKYRRRHYEDWQPYDEYKDFIASLNNI